MRAAIVNNNLVDNVVEIRRLSDLPGCVPCYDIPVRRDDEYRDGAFYRDGEKLLTQFEQLEKQHDEEIAALIEEIYAEDIEEIEEE